MFGLVEVMLISGGRCDAVRQSGSGINTDMGFHAEVPLIPFLGLVHLRITLTGFILGGAWRFDNRCVQQGSFFYQNTRIAQPGANLVEDFACQAMSFQ